MSLNPCCGGRCSSTVEGNKGSRKSFVLILVVVEDVLVLCVCVCLNPCCGGRCSSTTPKSGEDVIGILS